MARYMALVMSVLLFSACGGGSGSAPVALLLRASPSGTEATAVVRAPNGDSLSVFEPVALGASSSLQVHIAAPQRSSVTEENATGLISRTVNTADAGVALWNSRSDGQGADVLLHNTAGAFLAGYTIARTQSGWQWADIEGSAPAQSLELTGAVTGTARLIPLHPAYGAPGAVPTPLANWLLAVAQQELGPVTGLNPRVPLGTRTESAARAVLSHLLAKSAAQKAWGQQFNAAILLDGAWAHWTQQTLLPIWKTNPAASTPLLSGLPWQASNAWGWARIARGEATLGDVGSQFFDQLMAQEASVWQAVVTTPGVTLGLQSDFNGTPGRWSGTPATSQAMPMVATLNTPVSMVGSATVGTRAPWTLSGRLEASLAAGTSALGVSGRNDTGDTMQMTGNLVSENATWKLLTDGRYQLQNAADGAVLAGTAQRDTRLGSVVQNPAATFKPTTLVGSYAIPVNTSANGVADNGFINGTIAYTSGSAKLATLLIQTGQNMRFTKFNSDFAGSVMSTPPGLSSSTLDANGLSTFWCKSMSWTSGPMAGKTGTESMAVGVMLASYKNLAGHDMGGQGICSLKVS